MDAPVLIFMPAQGNRTAEWQPPLQQASSTEATQDAQHRCAFAPSEAITAARC